MEEINEKLHMTILNFNEEKREKWMRERKPFSVLFEITARCNFNCVHCYLQHFHGEQDMTYEQIVQIMDILYDKGILFLTFTGGEILTRKDFDKIYLYAKKKGFLVELFTNGYFFTDNLIEILKKYPPLLVDISLYGANEETFYKVTGVHNAFERVIENCIKIREAGVRISLKSPIIDITLPELTDMKKLAERLDIPFVYTFDICPTIDKNEDPRNHRISLDIVLKNEFEDYYSQITNGTREKISNHDQIIEWLLKNEKVYSCNVAMNSFVIDYQGNMCPCMKLRHRGIKLENSNYDMIWDEFGKYGELVASDKYKCKGCESIYYCDICPAEMDLLYGNPEYRDSEACKSAHIRKAFYEDKISFEQAINLAKP